MTGGIKLYLAAGAILPVWIIRKLEQPDPDEKVKIELEDVNGNTKKIRVLKIIGGEASFSYPVKDDVSIKFPDEQHAWGAGFDPLAVLQISTLDGTRVERNRLLCEKCFDTTGKIAEHHIGPTCVAIIRCNKCNQEWESQI